ncbi:hypothetical protein HMI54_012086 [Coelomomyces lativittatus]|nr:hypothetical protein HMI56_003512 [Coelomomyces lativittatus]KAJ1506381.1 hypothetical protein HMI55_001201 [Coelomomyces lativittatus]KAJ1515574.1 hypothetical protein HMI54_012086 [Coelomomyces lativittatus]
MHLKTSTSRLFFTWVVLFLYLAAFGNAEDFLKKLDSNLQGAWVDIYFPSLKPLQTVVHSSTDATTSTSLLGSKEVKEEDPSVSETKEETKDMTVPLRGQGDGKVTVTPETFLEEMASFSKVLLSSELKEHLIALSPAGLFLALGRFIDLTHAGTPSYTELTQKWKLNPEKTTPQNLAFFDTYLGQNHINSVSLFYQPPKYKQNSDQLVEKLRASGTHMVYSQEELNAQVNQKTQGGIKEVKLPSDSENIQVLYNILNFKFGWYETFNRDYKLDDFFVENNKKIRVSYMFREGEYVFIDRDEYKAVKLDFLNDATPGGKKERLKDFSAYVVRSKNGKGLDEIWEEVHQTLSHTGRQEARVQLPTFRTEQDVEISSTLFPQLLRTPNTDFPLIAKAANAASLEIKIKQKTFVCADEKGSLGGGVTAIINANFGSGPANLNFKRPFFYIIAGNKVATPLFVSYVTDGMRSVDDKCS